jgi:hypothetical protein
LGKFDEGLTVFRRVEDGDCNQARAKEQGENRTPQEASEQEADKESARKSEQRNRSPSTHKGRLSETGRSPEAHGFNIEPQDLDSEW